MPFDGTSLDAATQLLIAGRARVEAGWCQYKTLDDMDNPTQTCMGNAIHLFGNCPHWGDYDQYTLAEKIQASGRLHAVIGGESISSWQDERGRTKEEVLAAFDRAIAGSAP